MRLRYDLLWRLRQDAPEQPRTTWLLGRKSVVVGGPDGARFFYDRAHLRRRRAVPFPLAAVLFGRGAVHGLDPPRHTHRKTMFLRLLTPDAAREIAARADVGWTGAAVASAPVFDVAVHVHARAICDWAGLPRQDDRFADDLAAMVDGFGSVGGRRYWAGVGARRRADRRAAHLVREVRAGRLRPADDSTLAVIARQQDLHGRQLAARVAGVELLNVLRPAVAVSYFAAFAAVALADPALRARLKYSTEVEWEAFAHELRRLYPFVPALAARAKHSVGFRGVRLRKGDRVVLDVYGSLHDPALWPEPERFDLDRFAGHEPDAWGYFPQGAGDPAQGHRCPGERVTIELIKSFGRFLAARPDLVPERVSDVPLTRIPPRPAVRLVRRSDG